MSDPKLKLAMAEIKAILEKNDIGGVIVLHSPKDMEYLVKLNTTWTALRHEGDKLHFKCLAADYASKEEQNAACTTTIGVLAGTVDMLRMMDDGLTDLLQVVGAKTPFSHITRRLD